VGCDGHSSPGAKRVQAMLEKVPELVAFEMMLIVASEAQMFSGR
jgi:hypothetical protein